MPLDVWLSRSSASSPSRAWRSTSAPSRSRVWAGAGRARPAQDRQRSSPAEPSGRGPLAAPGMPSRHRDAGSRHLRHRVVDRPASPGSGPHRDDGVGHHLRTALRAAAGPEEPAADVARDHHLGRRPPAAVARSGHRPGHRCRRPSGRHLGPDVEHGQLRPVGQLAHLRRPLDHSLATARRSCRLHSRLDRTARRMRPSAALPPVWSPFERPRLRPARPPVVDDRWPSPWRGEAWWRP